MSENKKKKVKKKYSIFNPSPKLLKTLKSMYENLGGTVTYVFCEEKLDFSDPEFPLGKVVIEKSSLSANINKHVFFEEVRGGKLVKRTPQEIIHVFETTRHDLGATYFIIS